MAGGSVREEPSVRRTCVGVCGARRRSSWIGV